LYCDMVANGFEAMRTIGPRRDPLDLGSVDSWWRIRSEVLPLQWRQVDFRAGIVHLEPGTTKNKDGRTFYLIPELRACLEAQRAATEALQRQTGRIIPWVFHREGTPMKSFWKAWKTACKAAGAPGRIPHDFRRTAVRNLERAGVPRSVAMKMVGHKTEAIYRRYAIVSDADLQDAAKKLAAASASGDNLVTVAPARNPARQVIKNWWAGTGLNRRHQDFQTLLHVPARTGDLSLSVALCSLTGRQPALWFRIGTDADA
jgi:hypothetical protein